MHAQGPPDDPIRFALSGARARDQTGAVPARVFQNADALAGRFERGDICRVVGAVERFRDQLVIEVSDIARAQEAAELDPSRFLPSAYRDLDELDGFLEHLAGEVYDRGYQTLLRTPAGRPGTARRLAAGAVHAVGPPCVPGRSARAHGRRSRRWPTKPASCTRA